MSGRRGPVPPGRKTRPAATRAVESDVDASARARNEQDARAREFHDLRPHDAKPCPRVLAGQSCLFRGVDPAPCLCQHRALDHARRWVDPNGCQVLTGEPYDMDGADVVEFVGACHDLGLTVTLDGRSPWNPGQTFLLRIEGPG